MTEDLHHEMKVARFWRSVIGEYEYVNYDADDLFRWYEALETRGPEDIRAYVNERSGKYPMATLQGLVAKAPHPPMNLVMLWLESHELRIRTMPYWLGAGVFLILCLMLSTGLRGCENLRDPNVLALQPGKVATPLRQAQSGGPPAATATAPTGASQSSTPSTGQTTSDGAPAAHR